MAIAYLRGLDALALLSLVPGVAILAVTAWSLECICGILHTIFSDTQQIAEITLQALFYATPVIYLPESLHSSGWLHRIVACNPLASLLELVRQPLLHGELPTGYAFAVATAFMCITAGVAWWSLRTVERSMVLWL